MSIFSQIRRSRQRAKEHNAKLAEQEKKESESIPYRHVPTHAAIDAIASAPPSWRDADRPKIKEQNRRRSAMAAHGHNMNMPPVPRLGTCLSHVSFPSDEATPAVPRLPRAYSYNGYPGAGRQFIHPVPDVVAYPQSASLKGKEVDRVPFYGSPHISPSPSKEVPSPVESSSNSVSSSEILEMEAARRPHTSSGQPSTNHAAAERTHRLHPSRRRLSDASIEKMSTTTSSKSSSSRDPRPPPSMRGFNYIPPVPPIPPIQLGHSRDSSVGSLASSSNSNASGPSTPRAASSRNNSTSSFQGFMLTPTDTKPAGVGPSTPRSHSEVHAEFPMPPTSTTTSSFEFDFGESVTSAPSTPTKPRNLAPRVPKTTRFTELENVEPGAQGPSFDRFPNASPGNPGREVLRPLALQQVVNTFPEAETASAPVSGKTKGKLRKSRASVAT